MNKKIRKNIFRIVLCFAVLLSAEFLSPEGLPGLLLYIAAYGIISYDVVWKACRNIAGGQVFDENFLMAVASVGAFFTGQYVEAAGVMLFYQIGETFSDYAVDRSRKSIAHLMEINPEYANVLRNGEELKVDPYEIRVGEIVRVKPGERIPLDGVIVKGSGSLDTSAMTGEAVPRDAAEGEAVISGCINLNGVLEIRVEKEFDESTVSKILELVENATNRKAKAENFISKFAKYYTPIVVFSAAALAVLPPLVLGGGWSDWIYRALSFLVISCPCALVISVPLSFFGGLGAASKNGILIKGSNYMEGLANLETAVFDKTGTLTTGVFSVTAVETAGMETGELLRLAAAAERFSNHPIAVSVQNAFARQQEEEPGRWEALAPASDQVQEVAGYGIRAELTDYTPHCVSADGPDREEARSVRVLLGNERWMQKERIVLPSFEELPPGTILYLAVDGKYRGYLAIGDAIKADTPEMVNGLKAAGVKDLVMLTGDKASVGVKVAEKLGMTEVFTELLPGDKVQQVEKLLKRPNRKGSLIFMGDGMNDAPVLSIADIGIAMGGIGSDAAIEAADVVIMNDEPSKLVTATGIAKKTMRIVKQNIVFAIGVKILVLLLAAVGLAGMWAAVFADVGVLVLAILNAMRALIYSA
ncbi:MAG: heavy metal translocating P-type ATPase [Lachnospiraceae bacterium]|nr:heavy metal translocating P-type ATPase [Lachnospiraceae bacterium]